MWCWFHSYIQLGEQLRSRLVSTLRRFRAGSEDICPIHLGSMRAIVHYSDVPQIGIRMGVEFVGIHQSGLLRNPISFLLLWRENPPKIEIRLHRNVRVREVLNVCVHGKRAFLTLNYIIINYTGIESTAYFLAETNRPGLALLVLSKIVQFRTGHALVGAWSQFMDVQPSYEWSCGELESIPNILKDCVLREHIRDI